MKYGKEKMAKNMGKFITDSENICLRCKKSFIMGRQRPSGAAEMLAWCVCNDVNLSGANKGSRRQCKAFEPKESGDGGRS